MALDVLISGKTQLSKINSDLWSVVLKQFENSVEKILNVEFSNYLIKDIPIINRFTSSDLDGNLKPGSHKEIITRGLLASRDFTTEVDFNNSYMVQASSRFLPYKYKLREYPMCIMEKFFMKTALTMKTVGEVVNFLQSSLTDTFKRDLRLEVMSYFSNPLNYNFIIDLTNKDTYKKFLDREIKTNNDLLQLRNTILDWLTLDIFYNKVKEGSKTEEYPQNIEENDLVLLIDKSFNRKYNTIMNTQFNNELNVFKKFSKVEEYRVITPNNRFYNPKYIKHVNSETGYGDIVPKSLKQLYTEYKTSLLNENLNKVIGNDKLSSDKKIKVDLWHRTDTTKQKQVVFSLVSPKSFYFTKYMNIYNQQSFPYKLKTLFWLTVGNSLIRDNGVFSITFIATKKWMDDFIKDNKNLKINNTGK